MDYIAEVPTKSVRAPICTVRAGFRERWARRWATHHEECGKHCIPAAGIDAAISHPHPTGVPFVDLVLSCGPAERIPTSVSRVVLDAD